MHSRRVPQGSRFDFGAAMLVAQSLMLDRPVYRPCVQGVYCRGADSVVVQPGFWRRTQKFNGTEYGSDGTDEIRGSSGGSAHSAHQERRQDRTSMLRSAARHELDVGFTTANTQSAPQSAQRYNFGFSAGVGSEMGARRRTEHDASLGGDVEIPWVGGSTAQLFQDHLLAQRRHQSMLAETTALDMYKCRANSCKGNNTCGPGQIEPMCALCGEGWLMVGTPGTSCVQCDEKTSSNLR